MTGGTTKQPQVNVSKQAKKTIKHWVAVGLFAAIIVVFALWGVRPGDDNGNSSGGVAAVVNDTTVSLAEYKNLVDRIEQNAQMRFAQFPEAQRKMFAQEMRRRALEDLIGNEVKYQAATQRGVVASDSEVRDFLLQVPFLQENGRFARERYRLYLENMHLSGEQFERLIRKEIVGQKLQNLFVGAASLTRDEVERNRLLSQQKVNLRFVNIQEEAIKNSSLIKDSDIATFVKVNGKDVESYYKSNPVEFTNQEMVKAKHILIKTDDKRKDADALHQAQELRKQLNAENFSKLAAQHSEDPGSKAKGGELGEFTRGRMVPEFENAAFSLKEGEISQPVKTNYGYHILFVEKKTAAGLRPMEEVQNEIARKLLARGKQTEILEKAKALAGKGSKGELDAWVNQNKLKWTETGEFDLASGTVPKLEAGNSAMAAVFKQGRKPGIVPEAVPNGDGYAVIEVLSWRETPDAKVDTGDLERSMAYRKSSDLAENWSKEITAASTIQRNTRLLQQ